MCFSVLRFAVLGWIALGVARAANVGPELFLPLPALTLAAGAAATPIPLTQHLRDPDVPGSAVRVAVRIGHLQTGTIDLALYDAQTPLTVANFLAYVAAGRYAANFIHRSIPGFVIQNGGFRFISDTSYGGVPTFAPILNEPGISNLRGTVAMAKLAGDPNSATSQWFINMANNAANLDAQNGGFTVFGRVLGTGMTVADAIAAVPRYDKRFQLQNGAFSDLSLTTDFLARVNFVETSTTRIAPLAFQVVADAPGLVAATVNDGVLSLVGSASVAGVTTIRVTATDLEGGVLEATFPVTVLSSVPLIAWRQTYFATTADLGSAANQADPDGDGLVNLLEYALGGLPTSATSAPVPVVSNPGGTTLALTYVRARSELGYAVQTTTDLGNPASWTTAGVAQGTPGPDLRVTATIPVSGGRRFLRLWVNPSP